jgi:hypothetical protein
MIDIENTINEYLRKLPRCTRYVVITSPKYGKNDYRCELIVSVKDLLPWAENNLKILSGTHKSDNEIHAATKALPLWLRNADLLNHNSSWIPYYMYRVIEGGINDFVVAKKAKIFCCECQHFVKDITMEKLDFRKEGDTSLWTDEWHCPQGHLLYYHENELRFSFLYGTRK